MRIINIQKEYKIIESDGTINPFGEPSNQDISNVNSEPIEGGGLLTEEKKLALLNLIRYGFKEWKAYLTSMTRTFSVVFSPVGSANPNDNIIGQTSSRSLRISGDFFGRHKIAAANILSPGVHVDEEFYLAATFGEIVDFLEDEDNDAESTASFTFENIRYTIGTTDPPPSEWPATRTWVLHIVSEDEPVEYTVDIIKPVELAKFLADDSGDIEGVTIIDIIPLVEE